MQRRHHFFFCAALDIAMASNTSRFVLGDKILGGFYDTILVRYSGEIGIKSEQVRHRFVDHLAKNIRNHLERKHAHGFILSLTHARLFLSIAEKESGNVGIVHGFLQQIPGVHSFSYCISFPLDIDQLKTRAVALARLLLKEGTSFAVRATREGTHAFTSQEISRDVGGHVFEALAGLHPRVDLATPDVTIFIEIRDDVAILYHQKYDGLGGMPRDISSPVLGCVGLVDGSWEACGNVIRRGANLHLVILYDFHDVTDRTAVDVQEIVSRLNADKRLVDHVFQLLDFQQDNQVRITTVPFTAECASFLTSMIVPKDAPAVASFLNVVIPSLIHSRICISSSGAPRSANDFKAIVSEFDRAGHGSSEGLRWIQAANTAVASMMPAGVQPLPILLPLIAAKATVLNREAVKCDEAIPSCPAGTLLDLITRPATREQLLVILQRAVDQRQIVRFDMIERCFLSRA
jgi:hypothetical protein